MKSMKKLKLLQFYQNYKLIIFPVLVGLASLILIGFVILPQIFGILGARKNLNEEQEKLNILEAKADELTYLDAKDLDQKLSLALYGLPSEKDFTVIIDTMRQLTALSGVSMVSLKFNPRNTVAKASSFGINISVLGSKENLDSFMDAVEQSPRTMKIVSVEVFPSGAGAVSAEVAIEAYYSATPKSLGSVDAPLPKISEQDETLLGELQASLAAAGPGVISGPTVDVPRGKANPFE